MLYAIDIETSGLSKDDSLALISIANLFSNETKILDPIEDLESVFDFFEKKPVCFFFNAPFDLFFLAKKLPNNLLPERFFDLQALVRRILPQPVTLKELAFILFTEEEFDRYSKLVKKFESFNFLERPLSEEAKEYALLDVKATKLLALQFQDYFFNLLDNEVVLNDLDKLVEKASINFQEILRLIFKNNLAGRLVFDFFARERIREISFDDEISRPNFRFKRTNFTTKKYSLKILLSSKIGEDLLRRADVLLPKSELDRIAYPFERSILEQAETIAYSTNRSFVQFTIPEARFVATPPDIEKSLPPLDFSLLTKQKTTK